MSFYKISIHIQKSKKSSVPSRKSPIFSSKFIFLIFVSSLACVLFYAPIHKVRKILFFFFFSWEIWQKYGIEILIVCNNTAMALHRTLSEATSYASKVPSLYPSKDCSFFKIFFYDFIFFKYFLAKKWKKRNLETFRTEMQWNFW